MTITLKVKDANDRNAYVAFPTGSEPHPAIIVFQEAFGVNHPIRDIADRLAKEGYMAIAPELFHRTASAGFEVPYTDFPSVMPHRQAIKTEQVENDLSAVYEWLMTQNSVQKENIGCIGFCMGGRISFIANTFLDLNAAISFYGGGIQNMLDRTQRLKAPHLFFWGGKDQHIKPEHIQSVIDALRKEQKKFINVEMSDADHGFFCNERSAYHPEAAAEAWSLVKIFLKQKLQKD